MLKVLEKRKAIGSKYKCLKSQEDKQVDMNIEEELLSHLHEHIRDNDTKYRDIQLILFFFGFRGEQWPTLEDAAVRFNVGDSENRRSERPRQIIKNKFISKVDISHFPVIGVVSEIIESKSFLTVSRLSEILISRKLVPESYSIKGILNLLQQFGMCRNYNIYTDKLIPASRNTIESEKNLYVLDLEQAKIIRTALQNAIKFPGLVGIASFDLFLKKNERYKQYSEILIDILRSRNDTWISNNAGDFFYIIEERDNTLINNLEKIKNIATSVKVDILSIVLSNAFKRRTSPKGNQYPSPEIIESYLKNSRYTSFNGTVVKLNLETAKLNDIEQDVIKFMTNKGTIDFVGIKTYLEEKGYSKPSIDKAILNSPLVFANKSVRKSYSYRLLSTDEYEVGEELERYDVYRAKLLAVCEAGTDLETLSLVRKEQQILREWLFDGKDVEKCAACKHEFSVRSLITAHKKPRFQCSFNERIDPHIVMPMCKFGCDHLYELGVIKVENGVIAINKNKQQGSEVELQYATSLIGNTLEQRWLKGNQMYFQLSNAGDSC